MYVVFNVSRHEWMNVVVDVAVVDVFVAATVAVVAANVPAFAVVVAAVVVVVVFCCCCGCCGMRPPIGRTAW